ncbi:MAG: hypothetical protein WB987_14560 [Candidatus Acidiferrales bacterium]
MSQSKPTVQDERELLDPRVEASHGSHSARHFKTYFLILLVVIFGPLGNVLLSIGMKAVGPVEIHTAAQALYSLFQIFRSIEIWLGIASLITFMVAYMLVLSYADYSFVQPAAALGCGIVALLGHFLLHESVTPMRWIGIAVICVGVLIVGQTPPRTTERT